jgi:penicillin-binding protein 1A
MADQGYISRDAADKAKNEPIVTAPDGGTSAPAQYFVDAVRQAAQRAGIPIANGGYHIYTTLDPALQRAAVEALVDGTARVEKRPGYRHPAYATAIKSHAPYLQGAVVAVDPATGDVRALVGGRNYATSPFDRVFALRQPGSAIKPLIYAAALADSIPANAIVPDTALSIVMPSGPNYQPGNADGQFLGPITLHEALVKSRNPVAVQLGMRVGIDTIAALAQRLGISSPIAPVPSSAIGASAVRPLELVTAYTAFANLGAVAQPRLITRIDDPTGKPAYARFTRRVHRPSDDAGRRRSRHGRCRASGRSVFDSRRREDGHDERQCRCLVRRTHAGSGWRCLARFRSADDDCGRRRRRLARGANLGPDDRALLCVVRRGRSIEFQRVGRSTARTRVRRAG